MNIFKFFKNYKSGSITDGFDLFFNDEKFHFKYEFGYLHFIDGKFMISILPSCLIRNVRQMKYEPVLIRFNYQILHFNKNDFINYQHIKTKTLPKDIYDIYTFFKNLDDSEIEAILEFHPFY